MRTKRHFSNGENPRVQMKIGMRNRPLIKKIEKALAKSALLRNEWERVIDKRRELHNDIVQTLEKVRHAQTVTQRLCSVSIEKRITTKSQQEAKDGECVGGVNEKGPPETAGQDAAFF